MFFNFPGPHGPLLLLQTSDEDDDEPARGDEQRQCGLPGGVFWTLGCIAIAILSVACAGLTMVIWPDVDLWASFLQDHLGAIAVISFFCVVFGLGIGLSLIASSRD
jgi:hypothetical protein